MAAHGRRLEHQLLERLAEAVEVEAFTDAADAVQGHIIEALQGQHTRLLTSLEVLADARKTEHARNDFLAP